MLKITRNLFILLVFCSCSDKSVIISDDRHKVFQEIQKIKIDENVNSESMVLGSKISNSLFSHPGYNASHSGGHLEGPKNKPKKLWSKDIGKGINKEFPLMSNLIGQKNLIFAMDTGGKLSALDQNNGNLIWEKELGDRENSYSASAGGIALDKNAIYAHLGGFDIFTLDLATGNQIWKKTLEYPVVSGPVVSSEGILHTLVDGTIINLNKFNGNIIWKIEGNNKSNDIIGTGSISINDNVAVIPGFRGDITVLNLDDGSFLLEDNLAFFSPKTAIEQISSIKANPSIYENNFYAVAQNGRLVSYNLIEGLLNWEHEISSSQMIWIAGDSLFVISEKGNLICIRREDGGIRWITKLPHKIEENLVRFQKFIVHYGPIVASERVYLVSSDNMLRIYNSKNGKLIDKIKFSNGFSTPPIIINSKLFLVNDNAKLYAFE
jgi:outer membrane protein assembly factor BamB